MLPMQTILNRSRVKLHDTDGITYDDDAIIDVANDGIRFIRRSVAKIQPELLMSTVTGTVAAGESAIELDARPLTIIEVAAGDKVAKTIVTRSSERIYHNLDKIWHNTMLIYPEQTTLIYDEKPLVATNMRHISDRKRTGTPEVYWRTGLKTINLYPVPDKLTAYTVHTIDDIAEVTLEDNSPLINDFDDFLIEYVVLRLAVDNEYDMSQEQAAIANIYNQIQQILAPPPPGVTVGGYWDNGYEIKDYGRRVLCV